MFDKVPCLGFCFWGDTFVFFLDNICITKDLNLWKKKEREHFELVTKQTKEEQKYLLSYSQLIYVKSFGIFVCVYTVPLKLNSRKKVFLITLIICLMNFINKSWKSKKN